MLILGDLDSEDERGDDKTTEIDSWRQCVDVPDEQEVPRPPNGPNPTTFPNPQSGTRIEITHFPLKSAGAPITNAAHQPTHYEAYHVMLSNADNSYAPFCSKIDWEIARWAKIHGPSSTAVSELLAIESVRFSRLFSILHLLIVRQLSEKLNLSYKNAWELNSIFAHKLPRRPPFQSHHVEIAGETVTVFTRNIISSIKALYGDTAFATHLIFRPERHYEVSGDRRRRLYHDMHTGDWWWEAQVRAMFICHNCLLMLIIDSTGGL